MRNSTHFIAFAAWVFLSTICLTKALRADSDLKVAVNVRVFNGYERTSLVNGKFKPETIVFGEGGCWNGDAIDKSLSKLTFTKVARTIADPLRSQGYIPSLDSNSTDLLILVFWGVTYGCETGAFNHGAESVFRAAEWVRWAQVSTGVTDVVSPAGGDWSQSGRIKDAGGATVGGPQFSDEALSSSFRAGLDSAVALSFFDNVARDEYNLKNSHILGYTDAYRNARELQLYFRLNIGENSISEVEANRYFVVLKAYDFRHAVREKKLRILWEALYSIYERGNDFDEQLLTMTRIASRYFGRSTQGLVHDVVPEGKVEVGAVTAVPSAQ